MKASWRRHLADRSTSPAPGLAERLGYGVGDTASNLFWKTFEFFLLYFYTDVFGLSPTQVATLFLFTRTLDAISDPLIGMLADRTQSRWGRFRPYLLWVPPALALAVSAMFYTPPMGDGGKLVYAYVTYGIVMIAYTAVNTPYGALMAVMTLDTIQRTRLATYRFVLAFVGAIAVQYWTLQWVDRIGHGDDRWGFFVVMTCYGIVSVGLYWVCFGTTRERIQAPRPASQNWFADLADLARNRPWMMLFFYSFLTLGAAFVRNSALVYYFKYFCNRGDLIATFLTAGSVAAIVGMILTRVLATRLGKKRPVDGDDVDRSGRDCDVCSAIAGSNCGDVWSALDRQFRRRSSGGPGLDDVCRRGGLFARDPRTAGNRPGLLRGHVLTKGGGIDRFGRHRLVVGGGMVTSLRSMASPWLSPPRRSPASDGWSVSSQQPSQSSPRCH